MSIPLMIKEMKQVIVGQ